MRQIAFIATPVLISLVSLSGVSLWGADPMLVNMVMPDAKVMAGINVQRAKTSPFGQFLLNSIPQDANLQAFVTATGFDPRKDLVEVLMASDGSTTPHNALVLARGTFNVPQIIVEAAKDGKHMSQVYNGVELITSTEAKSTEALAFIQDNIAIAGEATAVKAAIDRRNQHNAIDPVLAGKVSGFSAADAWSVSIAPLASLTPHSAAHNTPDKGGNHTANVPFNVDFIKTVQQSSGSVVFGSPVQISAEAVALTDQDATSLGDVIKLLVSMATMNTSPEAADFANVAKGLSVTTDHNTLKIGLSIPEDQLEKLLKDGPLQMHQNHKAAGRADLE